VIDCALSQFRKRLGVAPVVPLVALRLGSADVRLASERLAREIADSRIVAALRDVIVDAPFFILPAQFARDLRREAVRRGEKDFRAEGSQ
jgi:hypothetical protein